MDHRKILLSLITIKEDFDEKSKEILNDYLDLLKNVEEIDFHEQGDEYLILRFIVYLLKELNKNYTSSELLSVNEFRTIKLGIGLLVAKGILPNLFKSCKIQNQRLCFTVDSLLNIYQDDFLRPAILSVLNPLLLGLLQLSNCEKYNQSLSFLINDCQQSIMMKELMIILGDKRISKHLRTKIQGYLTSLILKPNGVVWFVATVCGDNIDIGKDWEKLETVSKLLATPQGSNRTEYYDGICSQLIEILKSKNLQHASTIIKYCTLALYKTNKQICLEKIIYVIREPLLIEYDETQVENCIECLERLPSKLVSHLSVPLFCLYDKLSKTVLALKLKIQDLLILLLNEESLKKQLYSVYLGHERIKEFGSWTREIPCQELATTLLNLTSTSKTLTIDLFYYLLEYLTLEETDMENIIIAVTVLTNLSNQQIIQKSQTDNPKPLFNFVQSLFKKDYSMEILYTGLMWINVTVTNNNNKNTEEFVQFLQTQKNNVELPNRIKTLIQQIMKNMKKRNHGFTYEDISIDNQEYASAMKDLSDDHLPVRAHGLMTLTRLIEKRDSRTMDHKIILLHIFKEHLEHEDSFIYLTSINGLCALATTCPESVIEILIQEYTTERPETTIETRTKIGEILIKTIKALGEMSVVYKNILINGFLCACKDPDSTIRASSLSCIGELCRVLGFRLGTIVIEILYCASCIMKTDKSIDCRRAAILLTTLLLRGLGKDVLRNFDIDLIDLFRALKQVRDTEDDPILRLHAQLGLEEFDDIVENYLFAKPITTLTGRD